MIIGLIKNNKKEIEIDLKLKVKLKRVIINQQKNIDQFNEVNNNQTIMIKFVIQLIKHLKACQKKGKNNKEIKIEDLEDQTTKQTQIYYQS